MLYILIAWVWIDNAPIEIYEEYESPITCENVIRDLEKEFKFVTYDRKCIGI